MQDKPSGKALDDHGIPPTLDRAVVDTLDAYDQDCGRKGRDELREAVARIQHYFRSNIADIDHSGPHSAADGLLVYSIPRAEWGDMCTEKAVFAKAESWSALVFEHAADRTARNDDYVALDRVRAHYDSEDRYPIVAEHP